MSPPELINPACRYLHMSIDVKAIFIQKESKKWYFNRKYVNMYQYYLCRIKILPSNILNDINLVSINKFHYLIILTITLDPSQIFDYWK